jgi:hypothetical protein
MELLNVRHEDRRAQVLEVRQGTMTNSDFYWKIHFALRVRLDRVALDGRGVPRAWRLMWPTPDADADLGGGHRWAWREPELVHVPHRRRRGRLVPIPLRWLGEVTHPQTIRKRPSKLSHKARLGRVRLRSVAGLALRDG